MAGNFLCEKSFIRAVTTHVTYAIYNAIIWWRLGVILNWFSSDYKTNNTKAAGSCIGVLYFIVQLVMIWLTWIKNWKWKAFLSKTRYCDVPMLLFVLFSIGPYGMAFHHQYKHVNPKFQTTNMTIPCFDLQIGEGNFFMFQFVMPFLLITHLLYPPDGNVEQTEVYPVGIKLLNAFDMMELLEDIGCIQTYSVIWIIVFYFALAGSSILLAWPSGIEENTTEDENRKWLRRLRFGCSICVLIFTDVAFFILRLIVMIKEKSMQSGFHFLLKNLLAAGIRIRLICNRN